MNKPFYYFKKKLSVIFVYILPVFLSVLLPTTIVITYKYFGYNDRIRWLAGILFWLRTSKMLFNSILD